MKRRPILIFLLFAAAAGTLVWVYLARADTPRPVREPIWTETLGDLEACCRRKHIKATQYDHFAGIADREQRHDIARVFRAMAASERVQENSCAEAIVRLGGSYRPPGRVSVFVGATDGNLERSLNYERRSLREQHGTEIDRALRRGNRYAARVLIWASAGDRRHVVMMEWCRSSPGAVGRNDAYLVCPTCGNLYSSRYRDFYCPCCQTDGRRFIRVE